MARNGSGTYTLPAGNPVTTGTVISSTWANNTLSDIATALTGSIAKDGQTSPTANLPMGSFKLTGLSAGTSNGDSVRYEQLPSGTNLLPVASGGTGSSTPSAALSALGAAASGANTDITSLASTGGIDIIGTNTNDAAATGYVGELVSAQQLTNTNFPTLNQYGDLTSISLTAGDWDVSGGYYYLNNGATVSQAVFGFGTVTGNSGTGLVASANTADLGSNLTTNSAGAIPVWRVSVASTTTIYFKYLANYSAGTPQARGTIRARRVR